MKKLSLILLTALITLLTPTTALADGMIIPPPNYYVNENEQKAVIWHDGKTETLILSIVFTGNAADFGWIIPVPSKPEVDKSPDVLFTALEELTQPRVAIQPMRTYGLGMLETAEVDKAVTVWETKKVDIYDISVVSSTESDALAKWFNDHNYPYPRSQSYILDEYTNKGWFFVAAKIDTEKLGSLVEGQLREGHATPLKITFASDKIVYPLKISSITGEHLTSDIVKTFSFENGRTEGWIVTTAKASGGAQTTTEEAYHGLYSLRATNAYENVGIVKAEYLLSGLTKRKNYVFSAYLKNYPINTNMTGSVYLNVSSAGEIDAVSSEEVSLSSLDEWSRLQIPFIATDDSAKLSIIGSNVAAGDGFYMDAVQVEIGTEATDFGGQTRFPKVPLEEEFESGTVPLGGYGSETSTSPDEGIFEKDISEHPSPEIGFIPPIPTRYDQVPILLYVFSDHKVDYPGFDTQWASWVKGKTIEKLASDEDGEPWMKTNKKMYLTKLWNMMSLAEMTDDLIIKEADDNKPVNAPEFFELTSWKFLVLFGILAAEVIGVGVFWRRKRSREKPSTPSS